MNRTLSTCYKCGRKIGYEGLCYFCKQEEKRLNIFMLNDEEVQQKLRYIIHEIEEDNFREVEDLLLSLISIKNIDSSDVAEVCLKKDILFPSIIYKDACNKTRDILIDRLYTTNESRVASQILCCLAMIGDDRVQQVFKDLEENPLPWRQKLYVGLDIYAQNGGWQFDQNSNKEMLVYNECLALEKTDRKKLPIMVAESNKKYCKSCGCELLDILTIDGNDEKLRFLGIDGVVKATICPNCICYEEAMYCQYEMNGESNILEMEFGDENLLSEDDIKKMTQNSIGLSDNKVNKFYGTMEDVNSIGGMANWVQDWVYLKCPKCNKTMKYFAQIQWDTIDEYAEGTLYFEICHDCQIIGMTHQQT